MRHFQLFKKYSVNATVVIALLTFFYSCSASKDVFVSTSFHEPANEGLRFIYSLDGKKWDSIPGIWLKPELGNQKVLRDPSIVVAPDGTFHLVWTSSWKGDLGFGYASSKDLIHWENIKMIPVMKNEPTTVNVWAPELFFDDEKNEYVIVWSSCIPDRFDKGMEDNDNNHRLYYTTTKDFNTFEPTKLLLDPGFSCIDATIVKRDKNDYVLVFKDNTRPNRDLRVAFSHSATGPYTHVSNAFTENFTEGPTVEKLNNEYLIYFDEYQKSTYGAVETKDFITFNNISDQISIPSGHKHGTIFKAPMSVVKNLTKEFELAQKQQIKTDQKTLSIAK